MPSTAEKIPVFKPLLEREELEAAKAALELGWLGMGSFVSEFERELARLIDVPENRVVAVSTGHAALHLSLLLAGVGAGDEVITPSFNNVADLQAILATGAEPVFCDVDLEMLCIDVSAARDECSMDDARRFRRISAREASKPESTGSRDTAFPCFAAAGKGT